MKLLRFLLPALLVACGGDDPQSPANGSGNGSSGQGEGEPPLEGRSERETECDEGSRKDTYAPGLAKTSGDVEVSILEAAPAPPAMGMNVMTFAIKDGAGPVDGATIRLTPYMPDHNHGSPWQPVVTSLGAGKYRIEKVQLPMAGRWSLMIEIQRPNHTAENVSYEFCVAEAPE